MDGQKLTKKQKKGLAFRQGKRKNKDPDAVQDLPDEDVAGEADVAQPVEESQVKLGKKRKRTEEEVKDESAAPRETKKRKGLEGMAEKVDNAKDGGAVAGVSKAKKPAEKAKRFILFVDNLPKDVTAEQITTHFSSCPTPPDVRLRTPAPTPKAATTSRAANRAKIFAFLEFADASSLQSGLKLHRSNLGGKLINVELTVGGGGKSAGRQERIKAKRASVRANTGEQDGGGGGYGPTARAAGKRNDGHAEPRRNAWDEEVPKPRAPKFKYPPRPQGTGSNSIAVG